MTSDPAEPGDRAASIVGRDDLDQQREALYQRYAELAASVADIEEQIAATFERMATNRATPDAARLRAKATEARQYAAKERERSAEHGNLPS